MEPTPHPLIVVIILNWNLATVTTTCVHSVLGGDYPRQRVLIVDNGSTDDSVAILRDEFGSAVDLIETGQNLYFAGGVNVGLEWALATDTSYILVLNNDTWIAPGLVSQLVATAEGDSSIGIVGPIIYRDDPPDRIWALGSRRVPWLPVPRDIGRGQIDRGQFSSLLQVDYLVGCAMLIRRQVLESVGLFDPSYQMYYEDADFSARVQAAGFRLVANPQAKMWHLVSASARRQVAGSRYQHTRYRVRFYRQHSHGPAAFLTHGFLLGQEIARSVLALLTGRPDLAAATLRGLRDGYRHAA